MKKKKSNASTIVLVLIFIVGLCLLAYPTFSDYWNSFHQSRAIAGYADAVAHLDDRKYQEMLGQAKKYNDELAARESSWVLTEEQQIEYEETLDVSGTGIIGYIEIDKIGCSLPIYHGTDDAVLQIAIGHIAGTSFPIGGESTHAVLSGHRGLPSAKLFTRLDEVEEGDTFVIRVLDETLTYEVDQILIVEPDDIASLQIEEGKDLVTLVTCTPYGINTHRLLVRGHRVENTFDSSNIRITSDAMQIQPIMVAPAVAAPILLLLLILLIVDTEKKKRSRRVRAMLEEENENSK